MNPSFVRAGGLCALAAVLFMAGPPRLAAAPLASKDIIIVQTPLEAAGVASQETNLGDLVADAVREAGNAPIALVAADEILPQARIPAGKVAATQIVQALRYADDSTDTVVVLNLTGDVLRRALERAVSRAPQPFGGFLQVSGLQVRYDPAQPEGKRVSSIRVGGAEISPTGQYRVATTRPIADGGLGYFQIWGKQDIAEDTRQSVAKSLTSYLAAHRTVGNAVEGRIRER